MRLISHRGNIKGIVSDKENRPSYIDSAIQLGLEVEVDVRYVDGNFWLGHDTADYAVTADWLKMRSKFLWLHCKDINAAHKLKDIDAEMKYFCHTSDPFVITSTGHLWVHDLNTNLNTNCIIPLLSLSDELNYKGNIVYAVCTDYISYYKHKFAL